MEYHIPLLGRRGNQIGESFPLKQVFGTHQSALGNSGRLVCIGGGGISPFRTEDAVEPAVFMCYQAHVVNIGIGILQFRQHYRMFPEPEMVNTVRTFGHGKKGFSVNPFYTGYHQVASSPVDRTGIEDGIDRKSFQEIRIRRFIKIKPPVKRHMSSGEYRMSIAFKPAMGLGYRCILTIQQLVLLIL